MTQLQFNLDFEKIKDDVMKSDLNDVVKTSIVILFNQYMEAERDKYMKTSSHERSEYRQDYRNGYYERDLVLNVGKVTLKVLCTRSGETWNGNQWGPYTFSKYKQKIHYAHFVSSFY